MVKEIPEIKNKNDLNQVINSLLSLKESLHSILKNDVYKMYEKKYNPENYQPDHNDLSYQKPEHGYDYLETQKSFKDCLFSMTSWEKQGKDVLDLTKQTPYFSIVFGGDSTLPLIEWMENLLKEKGIVNQDLPGPKELIESLFASRASIYGFKDYKYSSRFNITQKMIEEMVKDVAEKTERLDREGYLSYQSFFELVINSYMKKMHSENYFCDPSNGTRRNLTNYEIINFKSDVNKFLTYIDSLSEKKHENKKTTVSMHEIINNSLHRNKKTSNQEDNDHCELRLYQPGDNTENICWKKSMHSLVVKTPILRKENLMKHREPCHIDIDINSRHFSSDKSPSNNHILNFAVFLYQSYNSPVAFSSVRFTSFGFPQPSQKLNNQLKDFYNTNPHDKEKRKEIVASIADKAMVTQNNRYKKTDYFATDDEFLCQKTIDKIKKYALEKHSIHHQKSVSFGPNQSPSPELIHCKNQDLWLNISPDYTDDLLNTSFGELITHYDNHTLFKLASAFNQPLAEKYQKLSYLVRKNLSDEDKESIRESKEHQLRFASDEYEIDTLIEDTAIVLFNGDYNKATEFLAEKGLQKFLDFFCMVSQKFIDKAKNMPSLLNKELS